MRTLITNTPYKFLNRGLFTTALFALLSITSCKKYTELSPISSISEATAFNSAANIELVAVGTYNKASYGSYYANSTAANTPRGYPFGAAAIEQSEMRGEDMVNLATFFALTYQSTITTVTANNVNMWSNLFALINQANILIAGVEGAVAKGVITQTVANQYEAEGRFLRALAYHELAINFCRPYVDGNGSNLGVPYRTVAVTSTDAVTSQSTLARGTVAQDYTNILSDLDYAETNLPATSSNGVGRATKGAAIALKTRIYQHMANWAKVIEEGAKLGTGSVSATYTSPVGNYALTASPDGPFYSGVTSVANNNSNNTESIFSIANSAAANGGTNGALPNLFGPAVNSLTLSPVQSARGLIVTSPNLYNASFWTSSDTRRTLLQVKGISSNSYTGYFNWKYRDATNGTDYAPIIRYAEVLLNVAEAYSRTTALDLRALSLLNAVRNRAVATADRYTIANFTTQNTLTQAVLNERRIEFAGEGRRWADITRLSQDANFAVTGGGIPAKILLANLSKDGSNYNVTTRPVTATGFAAIAYSDYRYVWPIPSAEITANPTLETQQNPGY